MRESDSMRRADQLRQELRASGRSFRTVAVAAALASVAIASVPPAVKKAKKTARHGRSMHDCRWMNWYWSRRRLPFDGPLLKKELRMKSHRRPL